MHFYCLQHVPFETPGILSELLQEKGHTIQCIHLYRGDSLPSLDNPSAPFDGLVIMGGPMSVHDDQRFSWLSDEKKLIAAAIRANKKVLGICLGAQLIALVSGSLVYTNPEKEIGYWPLHFTAEADRWAHTGTDALFVFHWHGDTFDLPSGAVLLASTPPCVNQAFRLGDQVLGLQFHPEVTPTIIRGMVAAEAAELIAAPYIQSSADILGKKSDPEGNKDLFRLLLTPFLNTQ